MSASSDVPVADLLSAGRNALQIGDTAPDFEAETTEGRMRFHDWIGECLCVDPVDNHSKWGSTRSS